MAGRMLAPGAITKIVNQLRRIPRPEGYAQQDIHHGPASFVGKISAVTAGIYAWTMQFWDVSLTPPAWANHPSGVTGSHAIETNGWDVKIDAVVRMWMLGVDADGHIFYGFDYATPFLTVSDDGTVVDQPVQSINFIDAHHTDGNSTRKDWTLGTIDSGYVTAEWMGFDVYTGSLFPNERELQFVTVSGTLVPANAIQIYWHGVQGDTAGTVKVNAYCYPPIYTTTFLIVKDDLVTTCAATHVLKIVNSHSTDDSLYRNDFALTSTTSGEVEMEWWGFDIAGTTGGKRELKFVGFDSTHVLGTNAWAVNFNLDDGDATGGATNSNTARVRASVTPPCPTSNGTWVLTAVKTDTTCTIGWTLVEACS